MGDTKSTKPPRIHPREFSEKFFASKRYERPLELYPHEYHNFEGLAYAVSELAELDQRAREGTLGYTLEVIASGLLGLVQIMGERYQEQETERKAAEAKKKAKPKPRPKGGNVKDFNGPKKVKGN